MFTSSAEVFRIRQSLGDLRAYLRESGQSVRDRLAASMRAGIGVAEARARIDRVADGQGARFAGTGDGDVHELCRLAAALPSDDFPAFTFATALLLADRLQSGDSDDDLYWNWDAFRDQYALADPPVRAALMNGFRIGNETGRLQIEAPPRKEDCLTRNRTAVLRDATLAGNDSLKALVETEPAADAAGREWVATAREPLTTSAIIVFRYLYERPESMAPNRAADAPLIPWSQ